MGNNVLGNLKKSSVLLPVVLLFVIIAVVVLSRYGRVSVNLVSPENGKSISYTLMSTQQPTSKSVTTLDHVFSKTLSPGNYQIVAQQGDLTGYALLSVKGFFRNTSVSVNLKPQISRSIVGDNPNGCMGKISDQFISFPCGGSISQAKLHIAASGTTPGYVISNPNKYTSSFNLQNIIYSKSGVLAFVNETNPADNTFKNKILPLDKNMSFGNGFELSDLKNARTVSVAPMDSGFIAYDDTFRQIEYFETHTATPKKIRLNLPKDSRLKPIMVSTFKKMLVATFSTQNPESNKESNAGGEFSSGIKDSVSTEIHVIDISKNSVEVGKITVRKAVNKSIVCGTDRLCVLGFDGNLDIYSLGGNHQYLVTGIRQIFNVNDGVRLLREKDIVRMDFDKLTGFSEYVFGELKYCGLNAAETGYLLCVTDDQRKRIALSLDPNTATSGSVDKALIEIPKLSGIDTISISNQFVYVALKKGEPVYDPEARSFNFEAKDAEKTKKLVTDKLNSLGITAPKYTIKLL